MNSCSFCQKVERAVAPLAADGLIAELPYSIVLLGPWQFYRGYCLVVAKRHATELADLAKDERQGFLDDMCMVAKAIGETFRPRKPNYELLGNQVPHLHWHLFPRHSDDTDIRRPVWFAIERAEHDPEFHTHLSGPTLDRPDTISRLRAQLRELARLS
jgi:diadenosine tetraphosphate (Ap4A) HIT family hydrolase